jgi:7-carboxy-7-deazaguanine synthase
MTEKLDRETKVNYLNVHSIYDSISGEAGPVFPQGTWCTFVRLQGCPLHCTWCDTEDSLPFIKQRVMDCRQVADATGCRNILLTGGEPLAQPRSRDLIEYLAGRNFAVQVETSGAVRVPSVTGNVGWVVDIKCPSSGEQARNRLAEDLIPEGNPTFFKFVITDPRDMAYALDYIRESATWPDLFVFSPVDARKDLAQVILNHFQAMGSPFAERACLSLQEHKLIDMP